MSKLSALFEKKSFIEPPFWATDRFSWAQPLQKREQIEHDFGGYVQEAVKSNGIVFACLLARQLVFSEARFLWREAFASGTYGKPFGNTALALIERPWPNGTTGELLSRMEQDASAAGNFYATYADDSGRVGRAATGEGRRITRLRPDWVTIVLGSKSGDITAPDTKIIAFSYQSPTMREPVLLLPEEVCHYSPIPDPMAAFRGMSWITPIVREITADQAATSHKLKFFENGATLSNIVTLDKDVTPSAFTEFVRLFKEQHQGVDTAYKTLFLGGGADTTVTGTNMQQLDFKVTQGAGETRIAAAARVPAVILGISEGLAGSSLNQGNYSAARRQFADAWARPSWRMAAASLDRLVTPPRPTVRLYPDLREVAFLREDAMDIANIQNTQAVAMRQLTDAGYTPESVVLAMQGNDWALLKHSGLFSVQLQPPGTPGTTTPIGQPAISQEGNSDAQSTV